MRERQPINNGTLTASAVELNMAFFIDVIYMDANIREKTEGKEEREKIEQDNKIICRQMD